MLRYTCLCLVPVLLAGVADPAATQTPTPVQGSSVRSKGVILIRPDAVPAAVPTPAPLPAPRVQTLPASTTPPLPAPVIGACPRPFARPDLRLDQDAGFFQALSARLRGGKVVVVDLAVPYSGDAAPPAALAPWLSEVRSSGGSVTVDAYCQRSRSAFGNFFARLFGGGATDPGRPYRAARRYDVVLHSNALDQVVTQVEFRPRAPKRP